MPEHVDRKKKIFFVFIGKLTNNDVSAHKRNKMHVHLIIPSKKSRIKSLKSDYFFMVSMHSA